MSTRPPRAYPTTTYTLTTGGMLRLWRTPNGHGGWGYEWRPADPRPGTWRLSCGDTQVMARLSGVVW
jgi:hypothetical protein